MNGRSWMVLALLGCNGGDPQDPAATADTAGDTGGGGTTPPVSRYDAILALVGGAAGGATLYTDNCETCHELPGDPPGDYPPFATVVPLRTDLELVTATLDGFPSSLGPMRAYGDDFTDQQVADLVAYMRETFAR